MSDTCQNCGRELRPDDRFCSSCGAPRPVDADATGLVIPAERDTGPIPMLAGLAGLTRGMAVIVVQRGPEIGQRVELTGDRMTVGRSADSDIMLDDVTVSRKHAQFVADGEGWVLVDMGSLNGTYVNRAPAERLRLSSGDLIQIGKYRLQFLQADEDHPAE